MHILPKIGEKDDITYYTKNYLDHYYVIADLHRLSNHESDYSVVVARVDKAKKITWAHETELIIDKDYIKSFVINN